MGIRLLSDPIDTEQRSKYNLIFLFWTKDRKKVLKHLLLSGWAHISPPIKMEQAGCAEVLQQHEASEKEQHDSKTTWNFYNAKNKEGTGSYGRVVIKPDIHWDAAALWHSALSLWDIYIEVGSSFKKKSLLFPPQIKLKSLLGELNVITWLSITVSEPLHFLSLLISHKFLHGSAASPALSHWQSVAEGRAHFPNVYFHATFIRQMPITQKVHMQRKKMLLKNVNLAWSLCCSLFNWCIYKREIKT